MGSKLYILGMNVVQAIQRTSLTSGFTQIYVPHPRVALILIVRWAWTYNSDATSHRRKVCISAAWRCVANCAQDPGHSTTISLPLPCGLHCVWLRLVVCKLSHTFWLIRDSHSTYLTYKVSPNDQFCLSRDSNMYLSRIPFPAVSLSATYPGGPVRCPTSISHNISQCFCDLIHMF